jgi:uncharacterized membrane protein
MSPVWCFFGGCGGSRAPADVQADHDRRLAISCLLVPSAPVPVGGCLVYVPVKWVKPADFGVEALMSIYVSMGVTSPQIVD